MSSTNPLNIKSVPNASALSPILTTNTKQNADVKLQAILMSIDLDFLLETYGQQQTASPDFKLKNELEQRFLQLRSRLNNIIRAQIIISLPGNDVKILLAKFIKKILYGLIEGKGFEYSAPEAEILLQKKPEFANSLKELSSNYQLSYQYLLTLTEFALKVNITVAGWAAWMRSFLTYWLSDRSGFTYHMYNQKFLWLNSNSNLNHLEIEANKLLLLGVTFWLEQEENPIFKKCMSDNALELTDFKVLLLELSLSLSKKKHMKTAAQNEIAIPPVFKSAMVNNPASQTANLNATLQVVSVTTPKPENNDDMECIQNNLDISSTTKTLQDCFTTSSKVILPIIFSYLQGNNGPLNQNTLSEETQTNLLKGPAKPHCTIV